MAQSYYTATDKSLTFSWSLSVTGSMLSALIALTGCQITTVPAVVLQPTVSMTSIDPRIPVWLTAAHEALMNDQLTTPLDDNAYFRYLQVLSIDPQNEAAEQGIANIVDKYLDWSIQNVEMGRYHRAIDYLNKARSVDENHPNIATVANMIRDHINGHQKSFGLSRQAVREKDPGVLSELKAIARDITKYNASIVIEAPSDEMGRWIYQQLNESAERRVRARFEMTSRVRIRLYY